MNINAQRILKSLAPNASDQMGQLGTEAIVGTVTAMNPLVIHIENGWTLDKDNLVLSVLCKQKKRTYQTHWQPSGRAPAQHPQNNDHNHAVEVEFWRGLQVGDKVNMIKMSGNQRYFVVDRQGMELDE